MHTSKQNKFPGFRHFLAAILIGLTSIVSVSHAAENAGSATNAICNIPQFQITKKTVSDALTKFKLDYKKQLEKDNIVFTEKDDELFISTYMQEENIRRKEGKIVTFSYSDEETAHLKKIFPDFSPRMTRSILGGIDNAVLEKEDATLGYPFKKFEDAYGEYAGLILKIGSALMDNFRTRMETETDSVLKNNHEKNLQEYEKFLKEKNHREVSVSVLDSIYYSENFDRLTTFKQRQEYTEEAKRILKEFKLANEEVEKFRNCKNVSGKLRADYERITIGQPPDFVADFLSKLIDIPMDSAVIACSIHEGAPEINEFYVQEPFSDRMLGGVNNCKGIAAQNYMLPKRWRPEMKVKIRWNRTIDGKDHWITKTATIERYREFGDIFVHFFKNDEVRVVSSLFLPESPEHPISKELKAAPPEKE